MTAFKDGAAIIHIGELDLFAVAAIQNNVAVRLRQLVEGLVHVKAIVLRQRSQQMKVVHVAAIPAANRTFGQAGFGVKDHAALIEKLGHAQTVTATAGARRIVEGEQPRLQFINGMAATWTGIAGREQRLLPVALHGGDGRNPIGQLQCRFERFRQPQLEVIADFKTVHHHIDTVFFLLVEGGDVIQVHHNAIDPHAYKTGSPHLLKYVKMLAFSIAHHRGEQHELAALGQRQHRIHHLRHGLRLQRHAVGWAARIPDPGEQQAQIVVDLGNGAHRGSGVMGGRFLLDRDGG